MAKLAACGGFRDRGAGGSEGAKTPVVGADWRDVQAFSKSWVQTGAGEVVRVVRFVVADDHPVVAQMLTELLATRLGGVAVGVAASGDEAVRLCRERDPDLAVLDVTMPGGGGIEALRRIRAAGMRARVVLLTGQATPEAVRQALVLGVDGFLTKGSSLDDLCANVRQALAGQLALSPEASEMMRRLVVVPANEPTLSTVESVVLRELAAGHPIKAMATRLALSESGVYKVMERLRRKTGARTPQEMTLVAARRGLIAV